MAKKVEISSNFITIVNQHVVSNIDLNVEILGFERTQNNKEKIANYQNDLTIFFISKGSLFFHKGSSTTKLCKNNCFIFNPSDEAYYEINKNDSPEYFWITICGREVQNNIRLCGVDFNKLYAKVSPTEFNKILSILSKVFVSYECDGRNLSYFEMNYIYYQIMNILDNGIHKKMSLQSDSKNINHVDEALIYFSNHYTDLDFSITKVSKAIGIHKNYLSKLFKEQTGLTFNNYLLNRRMNLAVYYIRQGYTSVSEIASKVGFDDQFYFSKVFKKYNHITPTEEIKKHKKN